MEKTLRNATEFNQMIKNGELKTEWTKMEFYGLQKMIEEEFENFYSEEDKLFITRNEGVIEAYLLHSLLEYKGVPVERFSIHKNGDLIMRHDESETIVIIKEDDITVENTRIEEIFGVQMSDQKHASMTFINYRMTLDSFRKAVENEEAAIVKRITKNKGVSFKDDIKSTLHGFMSRSNLSSLTEVIFYDQLPETIARLLNEKVVETVLCGNGDVMTIVGENDVIVYPKESLLDVGFDSMYYVLPDYLCN